MSASDSSSAEPSQLAAASGVAELTQTAPAPNDAVSNGAATELTENNTENNTENADSSAPFDAPPRSNTYQVQLPAFEGPFDLLLHLIARKKVDIYDIPLAEITDDYLAAMKTLDTLDLEVTTEFLVVAATLIELKAARLLPNEDDPELDALELEARDLLYARLLDYRTFKEAAFHIRMRMAKYAGFYGRHVPLEPAFVGLAPDVQIGVDAERLAYIAAKAFARPRDTNEVDMSHVQPFRMTVREAASQILETLTHTTAPVTFAELTAEYRSAGRHSVSDIVVHFLACLELYKLDHIDLSQQDNFGTLTVMWTPDANLRDLSFVIDGYNAAPAISDDEDGDLDD